MRENGSRGSQQELQLAGAEQNPLIYLIDLGLLAGGEQKRKNHEPRLLPSLLARDSAVK